MSLDSGYIDCRYYISTILLFLLFLLFVSSLLRDLHRSHFIGINKYLQSIYSVHSNFDAA